jgi:hypothetical protein
MDFIAWGDAPENPLRFFPDVDIHQEESHTLAFYESENPDEGAIRTLAGSPKHWKSAKTKKGGFLLGGWSMLIKRSQFWENQICFTTFLS